MLVGDSGNGKGAGNFSTCHLVLHAISSSFIWPRSWASPSFAGTCSTTKPRANLNAIHFSHSLASSIVKATNRSETKGSDEAMYVFPQPPLPSIACASFWREAQWMQSEEKKESRYFCSPSPIFSSSSQASHGIRLTAAYA